MDLTTFQVIQLLMGTGTLVLLLRIAFMVGSYAQRVDQLEKAVDALKTQMSAYNHELVNIRIAQARQ